MEFADMVYTVCSATAFTSCRDPPRSLSFSMLGKGDFTIDNVLPLALVNISASLPIAENLPLVCYSSARRAPRGCRTLRSTRSQPSTGSSKSTTRPKSSAVTSRRRGWLRWRFRPSRDIIPSSQPASTITGVIWQSSSQPVRHDHPRKSALLTL